MLTSVRTGRASGQNSSCGSCPRADHQRAAWEHRSSTGGTACCHIATCWLPAAVFPLVGGFLLATLSLSLEGGEGAGSSGEEGGWVSRKTTSLWHSHFTGWQRVALWCVHDAMRRKPIFTYSSRIVNEIGPLWWCNRATPKWTKKIFVHFSLIFKKKITITDGNVSHTLNKEFLTTKILAWTVKFSSIVFLFNSTWQQLRSYYFKEKI